MGVDPGEEGNVSRRDHQKHLNWVFCLFFIELQLIYDVILVSGVHDSDLVLYIYWVGQNVCSGFSRTSYGKIQTSFSVNPIDRENVVSKRPEFESCLRYLLAL